MLCHVPRRTNCSATVRDRIVTSINSNETGCCWSVAVNTKPNADEFAWACYTSVPASCVATSLASYDYVNYTNSDLRLNLNSRPFKSQAFNATKSVGLALGGVSNEGYVSTCSDFEF